MLMGLEIGRAYKNLSNEEYQEYIKEAGRLPNSHEEIRKAALVWMDVARRKMFQSQLLVFTGAGSLYGLALEGAMKIWECPQIASVGYELEEGMHGPNYGYNLSLIHIFVRDAGIDGGIGSRAGHA